MSAKECRSTDRERSSRPAGASMCATSTRPSDEVIIPAAAAYEGAGSPAQTLAMRSFKAARNRAVDPSRAVSPTPTCVWARASTLSPDTSHTRVLVVPMSMHTIDRGLAVFSKLLDITLWADDARRHELRHLLL